MRVEPTRFAILAGMPKPRSSRVRAVAAVVFASSIGVLASARADILPPKDFVEHCTLDQQCPDGVSCWVRDESGCAQAARAKGLVERCQSYGASTGNIIFCDKDSKPPPAPSGSTTSAPSGDATKPDVKPSKGGCASCTVEGDREFPLELGALAAAVVAGALLRRRKSQ